MKVPVYNTLKAALVPEMETVPPHIQIYILSEYHSGARSHHQQHYILVRSVARSSRRDAARTATTRT